jgi:hypothetical protein
LAHSAHGVAAPAMSIIAFGKTPTSVFSVAKASLMARDHEPDQ